MAITLVILASFSVDFGRAYASKRQLQTATDAAALAAASSFAKEAGDCNALASNTSAKDAAEAISDKLLAQNRSGAVPVYFNVTCSPDGKALDVTVAATGDTPVGLGGVVGVSKLTTERAATARLDAPDSGLGLRPYMVCSKQLPPSTPATTYTKVAFPKKDTDALGGCPYAAGNRFTVDCPHDGNGDNGDLADNTEFGCADPISIVDPQTTTSPKALRDSLLAACDPVVDFDDDCLTSNPGEPGDAQVRAAWNTLVGKEIVLPVFCGTEGCDDPATTSVEEVGWEDQGNNTAYPVYRLAGVKVCGWHWGPKYSDPYDTLFPTAPGTDPCRGADAGPNDANVNFLLLAYTNVQISGTLTPTKCAVGDVACNLRRTLLVK